MKKEVNATPKGFHSVNAFLSICDAKKAIEFYQKVFAAKVNFIQDRPDGKLLHGTISIGDSTIMIAEECTPHEGHEANCVRSPSELGGTSINLYLYVEDADSVFTEATRNGAVVTMPINDMFWGDRVGMFKDPFGHSWSVATHKRDISPEEMRRGMEEFFSQQNG